MIQIIVLVEGAEAHGIHRLLALLDLYILMINIGLCTQLSPLLSFLMSDQAAIDASVNRVLIIGELWVIGGSYSLGRGRALVILHSLEPLLQKLQLIILRLESHVLLLQHVLN